MAEKTEQPTSHTLSEARKKGEVFRSHDISQALLFATAATVVLFGASSLGYGLRAMISSSLSAAPRLGDAPPGYLLATVAEAAKHALLFPLPLMAAVFTVAVLANFLQVRGVFSLAPLQPKLKHMNPLQGFKRIFFTGKTWFELVKNLVKMMAVLAIAYFYVRSSVPEILQSSRLRPEGVGELVSQLLAGLFYRTGAVFLVLSAGDFLMQRRFFLKQMKMSKEEVKKEYKDQEGDPEVKFARRELYHRLLADSGLASVPRATVVVVNPVHLAVALRYDGDMPAPLISARGAEEIAKEIVFTARRQGIPVVPDIPLARQLYRLKVGDEIPPDLYDAVVIVLEYVRNLSEGNND